jgi:hypothetical protein
VNSGPGTGRPTRTGRQQVRLKILFAVVVGANVCSSLPSEQERYLDHLEWSTLRMVLMLEHEPHDIEVAAMKNWFAS